MSKTIILLASHRQQSNTETLVKDIYGDNPYQLVNLLDYHIQPYSYSGQYSADDGFINVIDAMQAYDDYVFATPLYWYSMSGLMKDFFDRLTDLTTDAHKELGKALKGKSISIICAGSDPQPPLGFEQPFMLTAKYFGMIFKGINYKAFVE